MINKRGFARLFGSCTLFVMLSCIGHGEGPVTTSLEFKIIEQGFRSGIHDQRAVAIRDEAAWNTLWTEHKRGPFPTTTPPQVDFSREMVVAVLLGERRTGGYSVNIINIAAVPEGLRVDYEEIRPGRGCLVTMAITYPFVIVRLPRVEGPVMFNHEVHAKDCSSR